jgi:hydroxypyruvate isomerase
LPPDLISHADGALMNIQFVPNLSMLFTEVPFLERFEKAALAGFRCVEFLFPYDAGVAHVAARANDAGLKVALFDVPAGDLDGGDIGFLGNIGRSDAFRKGMDTALEAAVRLRCGRLNVLAGTRQPDLAREEQVALAVENLRWALPRAVDAGVTLLIEALNPTDFPLYLVHTTTQAWDIVRAVSHPHVKLQYDIYHAQMTEGNLITTITQRFPDIGHIQIADVPGRHEPGTGEIRFSAVFSRLDALGYKGYVGLEYRPSRSTLPSLAWMRQVGSRETDRDA